MTAPQPKTRFLFQHQVTAASGTQTTYVDAESLEQAEQIAREGGGEFYCEEVEVLNLGEPEHAGETTLDDFGDNDMLAPSAAPAPIDMVLHCAACGMQHIDAPEPCTADRCESGCACPGDCLAWTNPPHRSHKCLGCGHIWRPADAPTNGVQAVKTKGKADSPIAEARASAGPDAELPPLPEPEIRETVGAWVAHGSARPYDVEGFSEDQMRDYARAALTTSEARAAAPDDGDDGVQYPPRAVRVRAAAPAPAEPKYPPHLYTKEQAEWCERHERETTFEPLMDDYEAGNESFVEAARKSLAWFESWAADAYLRASGDRIPGSDE